MDLNQGPKNVALMCWTCEDAVNLWTSGVTNEAFYLAALKTPLSQSLGVYEHCFVEPINVIETAKYGLSVPKTLLVWPVSAMDTGQCSLQYSAVDSAQFCLQYSAIEKV